MNKRNAFLFAMTAVATMAVCAIGIHVSNKDLSNVTMVSVGDVDPDLVIDSANLPFGIPEDEEDYVNNTTASVLTKKGNPIELSFVNAKIVDGTSIKLAPRGKIYNFQEGDEDGIQLNGITSIKATFTGALALRTSSYRSDKGVI